MTVSAGLVTHKIGRLSRVLRSNNRVIQLQANNFGRQQNQNGRHRSRHLQPAAAVGSKVLSLNTLARHLRTLKGNNDKRRRVVHTLAHLGRAVTFIHVGPAGASTQRYRLAFY